MLILKRYAIILLAAITITTIAMEQEKPNHRDHSKIHSLKLICAKNILKNVNKFESYKNINSECLDYLGAIESVERHIKKLEEIIDDMLGKNGNSNTIISSQTDNNANLLIKDNSLIENHRSLLYALINSDSFTNNSKSIIAALDNFSIIKVCYDSSGTLDIEKMNLLVSLLTSPEQCDYSDQDTTLALEKIAINAIKEDLDLCRLLAFNRLLPQLEDEINGTSATFFSHVIRNCINPDITKMLFHLRLSEPDSFWSDLLNKKTNNDRTIIHYAAINNMLEIIFNLAEQHKFDLSHLIDAPDNIGQTPLLLAIRFSQNKSVKHLIHNGTDINLKWYTFTPLYYAQLLMAQGRSRNSSEIDEFKLRNATKIIQLLKDELYESCAPFNNFVTHRCNIM